MCEKPADINDLLSGQFVTWLVLSSEIDKAGFPFVLSVSSQANPLKITRVVVQLIPIDVINAQLVRISWDKRDTDQSVQEVLRSLPLLHRRHFKIAMFANTGRQASFLKRCAEGLLFAISNSGVRAFMSRRLNASIFTHQPRKSLGLHLFPYFHFAAPM